MARPENRLGPSMALALRAGFARPKMLSCIFVELPSGVLNNGAPREIRTPDHLVRSQVLYPAELWAQY